MQLPFLLAWRYIRTARAELSIGTMARVCFWAIAIGSFALTLIVAIMRGFEDETRAKFQNVHPPLIIHADGKPLAVEKIAHTLKHEFGIQMYAPTAHQFVAMVKQDEQPNLENIASLTAIDPVAQHMVTGLNDKIVIPRNARIQKLVHDNHVIIGAALAKQMDIHVGDQMRVLYAQPGPSKLTPITAHEQTAVVAGLFETGLQEFDVSTLYCSFSFMQALCDNEQATHIGIKPTGGDHDELRKRLEKRLGLRVISWQQLYPALLSALTLETWVMFFIISLIVLVASMNIVSLLFMQITYKQRDIAALISMGMPTNRIRLLFFIIGMLIGIRAAACGLIAAWLAGSLLHRYPFITLPDVYYVTHLPVQLNFAIFAQVFTLVIVLVALASFIPLGRLGKMNVSTVLRSE